MWQDFCNGGFEFLAGIFNWINVRRVYRDKEVKGYSVPVAGFFALWGFWNLYYYPHLNQWVSFFGGLSISLSNLVWIAFAIYYTKFYRRGKNV